MRKVLRDEKRESMTVGHDGYLRSFFVTISKFQASRVTKSLPPRRD